MATVATEPEGITYWRRKILARPKGTTGWWSWVTTVDHKRIGVLYGVTAFVIFLVVMPLGAAFFNYMLPLMIGARDVAFPRLNAFSYWVFLFGGLFLYSSFLLSGAPAAGWFGYAPLSEQPAQHMHMYALGLIILGIS